MPLLETPRLAAGQLQSEGLHDSPTDRVLHVEDLGERLVEGLRQKGRAVGDAEHAHRDSQPLSSRLESAVHHGLRLLLRTGRERIPVGAGIGKHRAQGPHDEAGQVAQTGDEGVCQTDLQALVAGSGAERQEGEHGDRAHRAVRLRPCRGPRDLADEVVAEPGHRPDVLRRAGVVRQGPPDLPDATGQYVVRDELLRPQPVEQLLSGHGPIGPLDQVEERREDLGLERDLVAGLLEAPTRRIEAVRPEPIAAEIVSHPLKCSTTPGSRATNRARVRPS